jgi:hypothetical protein
MSGVIVLLPPYVFMVWYSVLLVQHFSFRCVPTNGFLAVDKHINKLSEILLLLLLLLLLYCEQRDLSLIN